jgi:hypothetical protein
MAMEKQNPLDLHCPSCNKALSIAKYRCEDCNLTIDGSLEIPPLARLSMAEQAFVISFLRVHGNIKRMGQLYDISYPTVKSRLNNIARKLDETFQAPPERGAILERLDRGEIDADEALRLLDML